MWIDPGSKILRYPDVLGRIQQGARVQPLNVELDLTNRCNLTCAYCDFAHVRDSETLNSQAVATILEKLARALVRAVTFTGGGEPTVSPLFDGAVCLAFGRGMRVGVYTNGVKPISAEALECLDWVYVSLDEPTAAQYQATKGLGHFETVMSNIRSMVFGASVVGVGFLVHADNAYQIPDMVTLGRSLGATYTHLRPIVGLDDYSWVPDVLPLLKTVSTLPDVSAPLGRFEDLWRNQRGLWKRGYTICRGSELVPCVGADGTLWVCPNTRGVRPLGNLLEESLEDIWERRQRQWVGPDCRIACRNHELNRTLDYICQSGQHPEFV